MAWCFRTRFLLLKRRREKGRMFVKQNTPSGDTGHSPRKIQRSIRMLNRFSRNRVLEAEKFESVLTDYVTVTKPVCFQRDEQKNYFRKTVWEMELDRVNKNARTVHEDKSKAEEKGRVGGRVGIRWNDRNGWATWIHLRNNKMRLWWNRRSTIVFRQQVFETCSRLLLFQQSLPESTHCI